MDRYNITEIDVNKILEINNLTAVSISKFQKSGQRQVFEVEIDTNKVSILKFVDVSPYNSYNNYEDKIITGSEFEQEKFYEIEANSKRIIRELEASKKCAILPQLEILDGYQTYKCKNHHFIYYFESQFKGQTLNRSEVYQTKQNLDVVIQFLVQMIEQIKIMNNVGYVHRDLTPRNIIYNDGTYRIIDAGLIKSNEDEKLTATHVQIGTPYYMAPEQNRRTSDYLWDFRTDLYSIGLIAIEIYLNETRYLSVNTRRDMHHIFELWKKRDSSPKSIFLFTKVIARLADEHRHKRWNDLDVLLDVLRDLIEEDE